MFKVLGALCIIGGCGYAGIKLAGVFGLRTEVLRFMQSGLNLLETEISYGSTPLPLALRRVGEKLDQKSGAPFLHAASVLELNRGATASEAWEEGVMLLSRDVPLSKEEISILTIFGRGLGSSAREEQLKNIALTREQLRIAEKAALEAREKNQKMWRYMGFCLGTVIVLLLI